MYKKHFSPREFLKARRPERFSDSKPQERPLLDRSILEYHLGSITSRSQEADFARFAHRLAEREICPNLLPQTGPTGGGDSKVDAETYPVADGLSLVWHTGIGREASSERWAFAFSAMKEWRPKVRSDVAKLAGTGRGYTKAFFVTNQFVPDRARADVEDKLQKKHRLDVRILDRSWILDKVFGNGHQALAIEELRLATSVRTEIQKGPLDLQRERNLAAVEESVQTASRRGAFTFGVVDDCLEAAILARSLDKPRTEVDGLFGRATLVAKEHGTGHQQIVCAYQKAWTTFWWYEDYVTFADEYGAVSQHAKGSRNVYELELLTNLWYLLYASVKVGDLKETPAKLRERTTTLSRELQRLTGEANRPSTALQARTLLAFIRLIGSKPEDAGAALHDLKVILQRCEGLVGYPLGSHVDTLVELGEYLGKLDVYADLFELMTELVAKRKGDIASARMLLARGEQQLDGDRPFEAIRCFGRSLTRLHKHESRDDAVRAQYLCGIAYERVGLYWAARGSVLNAAALAVNDFWTYSSVTPLLAACTRALKWLEMKLGRIPQVLMWHEVDRAVASMLRDKGETDPERDESEVSFDAILGILFLRADLPSLKALSGLPDTLEQLELFNAAQALWFALGHEDRIAPELLDSGSADGSSGTSFVKWRDQPAARELPERAVLSDGVTVALISNVLGCRVSVDTDNVSPCVELAESALAALESFVSTAGLERVMAREPSLTIDIRQSTAPSVPFQHELRDRDGLPHVDIGCRSFHAHRMTPNDQSGMKQHLEELVTAIAARILLFGDVEKVLEKLLKDERALDRSINFTSSFATLGNVLGDEPKSALAPWLNAQSYPLKRSEVWDEAERQARREVQSTTPGSKPGSGEPPPELFDPERAHHARMRTVSVIREPLWERAHWVATAFAHEPGTSIPPIMALVFQDAETADQIFFHWHRDLGSEDQDDALRVTILRHIDRTEPHAYRVAVGSNPELERPTDQEHLVFIATRANMMTPSSSTNLERFLAEYQKAGRFTLTYAIASGGAGSSFTEIEIARNYHIEKSHLHVREAWQLGLNDFDAVALRDDDDPVIPADQHDPPVCELLRRMRERRPMR
jgi:hypothetical protein